MRTLAVIPVISAHTADICIESLLMPKSAAGLDPADILIVDNTREGWAGRYGLETYRDPDGHNLGVAGAWNIGAQVMEHDGYDYLTLMSSVMRFGPELHTTWTRQIEAHAGAHVIECEGNSWHLIAFHRSVFEQVGLFDTNFYPAYFEAIDFGYRMKMLGLERRWPKPWVNALSQGSAMHVETVSTPAGPLLDYYAGKWGGPKGEETWVLPYGDRPIDYFETVPIPELAVRYGLEVWW